MKVAKHLLALDIHRATLIVLIRIYGASNGAGRWMPIRRCGRHIGEQ